MFGLSAGAVAGIAGAGLGAYSANQTKKAAQAGSTTTQQLDPRAQEIIYGNGQTGQPGLLTQYQQLGQAQQNPALMNFGQSNLNYLSTAPGDMLGIRDAAHGLLGGSKLAPRAEASQIGGQAFATGNMVQAPSQNGLDLKGAYNGFINGERGNNPFLTGALQGSMAQSQNQFNQMQGAATENLKENILPGIRSASVLSGQYGGSRQGIAEGNAIGDHAKAMQQAAQQFGQHNTNTMAGAQAAAYETDSNRALAATQGLGAQQYGVAQQNAQTKNQAEFMNVGQVNQNHQNNAQMQQQTNMANLGAEQQQNSLNQNGQLAGAGLLSGQLGTAYGVGTNHDNYGLNKAQQTNGLLAPYLGQGGSTVNSQPMHQNTAGAMFGGALGGLGLYNQFKNSATGGGTTGNPLLGNPSVGGYGTGAAAGGGGTYYDGTQWFKG